jgi:hypothetical protein
MTFKVAAHPEHAAAHLERAIQTGVPVMLPGTRESRQSPSVTDTRTPTPPHPSDPVHVAPDVVVLDDRMGAAPVQNPLGRALLNLTERLIALLRTKPAA